MIRLLGWRIARRAPVVTLCCASAFGAQAATIYGTITQGGAPLRQARVTLSCGSTSDWRLTDAGGAYRLTVRNTGRCRLSVLEASAEVIVYDQPTHYDWVYQPQPTPALQRR